MAWHLQSIMARLHNTARRIITYFLAPGLCRIDHWDVLEKELRMQYSLKKGPETQYHRKSNGKK